MTDIVRRLVTMLVLACALAAPARGQVKPLAPPESVATQLIDRMRNLDWTGMATLMHPAALHQLRELLGVVVETPGADDMREQILGVRSVAAAKALSDTALFAAFMKAATGSDPSVGALFKSARVQILGHLAEGPDTVHVVYRMTMQMDSIPISRLDVASFARSPLGWRGLLKGDVTALATRLKLMMPRTN